MYIHSAPVERRVVADPTRICASCGSTGLSDAWYCRGCGHAFVAVPQLDPEPAAQSKRYYGSSASRRRVRSMALVAVLVRASIVK